MEKKYRLTDTTIEWNGKVLHQIEAVKDFGVVDMGERGGYVENESNLSHHGLCWIYDEAKVYGEAKLIEDACIYDEVEVSAKVILDGDTHVIGNSWIY